MSWIAAGVAAAGLAAKIGSTYAKNPSAKRALDIGGTVGMTAGTLGVGAGGADALMGGKAPIDLAGVTNADLGWKGAEAASSGAAGGSSMAPAAVNAMGTASQGLQQPSQSSFPPPSERRLSQIGQPGQSQ